MSYLIYITRVLYKWTNQYAITVNKACFLRQDLPLFLCVLVRESSIVIDGCKRIPQREKILERQTKKSQGYQGIFRTDLLKEAGTFFCNGITSWLVCWHILLLHCI